MSYCTKDIPHDNYVNIVNVNFVDVEVAPFISFHYDRKVSLNLR